MGYKQDFIKFMFDSSVLAFGDFTTKSGRKSPYFINTGHYKTGEQISRLGEFYADCIYDNGLAGGIDALFGVAYKAIPLCVAATTALYQKYNINIGYCFNRKEVKDHGEGGILIGHKPKDGERFLVIEDVMTAGTSLRETLPYLTNAADVTILGVVISADRMERGTSQLSAAQEVRRTFGFPVYPIVNVLDIIECMSSGFVPGKEYLPKMLEYRKEYGVDYNE